jgi:hypothetical protein
MLLIEYVFPSLGGAIRRCPLCDIGGMITTQAAARRRAGKCAKLSRPRPV